MDHLFQKAGGNPYYQMNLMANPCIFTHHKQTRRPCQPGAFHSQCGSHSGGCKGGCGSAGKEGHHNILKAYGYSLPVEHYSDCRM